MEQLLIRLCKNNTKEAANDAIKFFIRSYSEIMMMNPTSKAHTIPLDDAKLNLFGTVGAIDCLFFMGYIWTGDAFTFKQPVDLSKIENYKDEMSLVMKTFPFEDEVGSACSELNFPCTLNYRPVTKRDLQECIPPNQNAEHQLREEVIVCCNKVLKYEDLELKKVARSVIPLARLTENVFLENPTLKDIHTVFRDLLIMQLLRWFKTSFFRWFDKPNCTVCSNQMKSSNYAIPSEEDLMWEATRVEHFVCTNCLGSERLFPRYNHPGKLLQTREGRCGEWANCFGLLCRSLDYETRFVNDLNDHVWNEVFSEQQNRWLHCDPCEGLCDKPLVYKMGWGKSTKYILGFSKDELQDITWRYTNDQKATLSLRKSYREEWLLSLITTMTKALENRIPIERNNRRHILTLRRTFELIEFMCPPKDAETGEMAGRSSGSLAWKLARGEIKDPRKNVAGFVFTPTKNECECKEIHINYTPVTDKYIRLSDENDLTGGCEVHAFKWENISRKVEQDWKMAYLARTEGLKFSDAGFVAWKFDLSGTNLAVDCVSLMCQSATFENGKVVWNISNGTKSMEFAKGSNMMNIKAFSGSSELTLTAELSGGTGNLAWQHAQLFRVSLNTQAKPFVIRILLKEI